MLIKVFPHGKGGGSASVEYLLRLDYHGRKENPPEVLRGDPLLTRDLIDNIDREWKFTSGVCSWSGEDEVTPDQIKEVMDKFEEVAFAGLEADQYNILWVHHGHVNRCELHFVIPRIELSTGNAFNAFPPGWQKDFDPLRDYQNIKHNWTRPDDPARARMFTPSNADIVEARLTRWGQNTTKQDKEKARDVINNYIKNQIENGIITSRSDIITSLREIGLEINRESKNFITVKDSETNEKIRLKGGVYNAEWRAEISSRETQGKGRRGTPASREDCRRELAELEQKITGIIRKRVGYNRKRYPDKSRGSNSKFETSLQNPEHSIRQGVAQIYPDYIINDDRSFHSLMGNVSRTRILDQSKDGRTGRSSNQYTGTEANSLSLREGYIRYLPEDKREGQVYSPSEQRKNRNQLGERRQEFNQSSRDSLIHINELSKSGNKSLHIEQGETTHGKDRAGNNRTGNNQINRKGHRRLERLRTLQNFRFREAIRGSLGSIGELGRLTAQIAKNITRIRTNIKSPEQSLKSKQQQKSQGYSR